MNARRLAIRLEADEAEFTVDANHAAPTIPDNATLTVLLAHIPSSGGWCCGCLDTTGGLVAYPCEQVRRAARLSAAHHDLVRGR